MPSKSRFSWLDRPAARKALLFLLITVGVVLLLYGTRAQDVLKAVVDPTGAQVGAMERALLGYVSYGSSLLALLLFLLFTLLGGGRREGTGLSSLPIVLGGTLLVVGAYVNTLVFRDYGIHFYQYDLLGLLTDAATARDVGIRKQDLVMAAGGVGFIFLLGFLLYGLVGVLARFLPSGTGYLAGAALSVLAVSGLGTFGMTQGGIQQERHDFLSTLPARGVFLPGSSGRPHLAVEPRLGRDGYPDPRDPSTPVPDLDRRKNVLLILADGFRADHLNDSLDLTPNLTAFQARPEVISPRRHYSTGPFTEMGIYGLVYGLNAYTYFSFLEHEVPAFPLEVFRRNGYVVAFITGSRVLQFPSGQLLDSFDEVTTVDEDPLVFDLVSDFLQARESDGRPYFLITFYYAPHWPFDSVEEENRRFRPDLDDEGGRSPFSSVEDAQFRERTRNSYRNSVIQFDERFGQTFELVRDSYEVGETVVGFTSDHGTELWEHGLLGQGRSTFWNEKVLVPFLLGLPGAELSQEGKRPAVSSHTDLVPTLLDFLQTDPTLSPRRFSHGRSLLREPGEGEVREPVLGGRYFPWADRLNALVLEDRKLWFHASRGTEPGEFQLVPSRVMDLNDESSPGVPLLLSEDSDRRFREDFWRFLKPVGEG